MPVGVACPINSSKYSTRIDPSYIESIASSSSEVILDCKRIDGIYFLALNRKANKNALSACFVRDISDSVSELEKDKKSRALIICSLVDNVFCSGADLKERAKYTDSEVPGVVGSLRSLFQRIHCLPMPTIAAIDGAALGGGLELALACDLRFAGHMPRTSLGLVETHWALLPGAGGSQRLPRLIGSARAKELVLAARVFDARTAASYGLVNSALEPAEVPDAIWRKRPGLFAAIRFAEEVVTKGPLAVRQAKKAIQQGLDAPSLEDGLLLEAECYRSLVSTKDRQEGMKAFAEKRQPVYHGL
ncbi:unnamed protein product [Protopolystoma xenopodis]|uniref:Enoyl-CoA hydratase n=1 Tax=Protopolystoma xenopodis TaxID=117903 RepID=A0A3S5ASQ4_9PLAT|nr:unnamed protein product [Protopolystoma xenopodis]